MINGTSYRHVPNFGSLSWFWSCKEHTCPLSPYLGLWRMLEFLTWVWYLDLDLDMVACPWYTYVLNFGSLSWFWRCKEHQCPLSPHLGLWRMLDVPDRGWVSWSWFRYDNWSLIHLWFKFWLSILILKVQSTAMSFESSFGALEDAWGTWLLFGTLILI